MKKRVLSLALTALMMVAVLLPAAVQNAPEALGATHQIPLSSVRIDGVRGIFDVGPATGITTAMLQTINRIEFYSGNNSGNGISLYANGIGSNWWDDTEVCEIGQQGSPPRFIFDLEWKRGVWSTDSPGNNINIGCAWWTTAWSSLGVTRIDLIYGEPLRNKPLNLIGTIIAKGGTPGAGRITGQGTDQNPVITAADVTMLRRYIADPNKTTFPSRNPTFILANADVNGDDQINAADVTLLRQYLAATDPTTVTLGKPGGFVPWNEKPMQRNAKWYMAITLDDGPIYGPSTTGSTAIILDALASARAPCGVAARATWFVCGRRITAQTAPLVTRMAALGHDVENHTWGHGATRFNSATGDAVLLPPGQAASNVSASGWAAATAFNWEIARTSDRIEEVTGRKPIYFRFPEFAAGTGQVAEVERQGMRVIHAQADSRDFNSPSVSALSGTLKNGGSLDGENYGNIPLGGWNGVNMLFHDAGGSSSSNMYTQNNAAIFADAIPYLQGLGYAFVTVEEKWRRTGTTPATGGSTARFNGHTGQNNWNPHNPGPDQALARFQACSAQNRPFCNNPRCP
jgi:peptidoglycan/xylan/chitin deacetylase (PgdA/CDA1 family)